MRSLSQLLCLFFISITLFSCKIQSPTFGGFESYRINKANAQEVELQLNLKFNNPNDCKIVIKKYELDISVNGNLVGKAISKEKVVLAKNSEEIYPFFLKTDLKYLLAQVMPNLSALFSNKPIELKLEGKVKAGAYGVSKKFPISVSRPLDLQQLMKIKE